MDLRCCFASAAVPRSLDGPLCDSVPVVQASGDALLSMVAIVTNAGAQAPHTLPGCVYGETVRLAVWLEKQLVYPVLGWHAGHPATRCLWNRKLSGGECGVEGFIRVPVVMVGCEWYMMRILGWWWWFTTVRLQMPGGPHHWSMLSNVK